MKVGFPSAAALALAGLVLPRLAQACPMCASQQPGGVARIAALGLMLLLPFGIAFFMYGALRRAGGLRTREGSKDRASAAGKAGNERARGMRELNP